jgi:ABC-type Fe3+/spermidine/putrescine transport system ATPase subunit
VPPLVADHIAKTYDGATPVPVIADLSLTLEAGRIVSIVGPSGCGKTTSGRGSCPGRRSRAGVP